jgi:hypothetical protein
MTPLSPEALQAFLDVELTVLASLFRSAPLGALVLLAAVALAVAWLSWTETGTYRAHHPHARA